MSASAKTDAELKTEIEKLKNLINGRCQLTIAERRILTSAVVRVFVDKNNPQDLTCTCYDFLKYDECKHSLCLLIKLKLKDPPNKADTRLLGQKRSRGRAAKAKKALIQQ